jgi:hypothetical protein
MLNPVYCRRLEDQSGWGVFQRIIRWAIHLSANILDEKWEVCLGLGNSRAEAWSDYRNRKFNRASAPQTKEDGRG